MQRVLFCGTNEQMIENVMNLIAEGYDKKRAMATEADFIRSLRDFKPHVVIVCLQNETRERLRMYDILCTDPLYVEIPVIAMGYEDDCTQFTSRIPAKNMETFFLPLNRKGFFETLEAFVKLSRENAKAAAPKPPVKKIAPIAIPLPPEPTDMVASDKDENLELGDILSELGLGDIGESEKALVRRTEYLSKLHGTKSILVVDDDVRMLNVIKLYLQDLYEVTVVPSGKLALKFIERKHTDLILLDYMMPDMDGPDVLKEIRENSSCKDVPVVFLTGVADKALVMRGLEFSPAGYLLKPITRELLLEKVTEILLGLK